MITRDNIPPTLLDQVRWLYENQPDYTALVLGEESISYRQFFDQAARYARALDAAGIQRGDLVALILQHGEDVLYGFWGAMLLGAVPSIFPFLSEKLDRDRYFDSVRQLVAYEGIRVAITYSDLMADLRRHVDIPLLDKDTVAANGDAAAWHPDGLPVVGPDDTAFLQHSSGSTGLQKGVMLAHRAVLNQIASYSEAIRLQADDVVVSWLPLYHDMGLIAGFIMPLVQGIKLVLMSPFQWVRDPKQVLWAIHQHRGTLCWQPNFAYNFLTTRVREADIAGLDLSSWRAAVNCSEPVYAESHDAFAERYAAYGFRREALTACYAMAENTFAVTQGGIEGPLDVDVVDRRALMEAQIAQPAVDGGGQAFVSNGKPIPGCEVRIAGANGERQVGEIALRSDSMLSGYYNRPDLEPIRDGWYLTGDMGYMADGELYITGRKKDLIIVGGKNIYPQDIEMLVNAVDGVHPGRAAAFGVFNPALGTEDLAIVAEVDGDPADRDFTEPIMRAVRARVAQNTDVTARYVHLVGAGWLLKTSSGKVARRANREKFLDETTPR